MPKQGSTSLRLSKRTVEAMEPLDRAYCRWDNSLTGFGVKVTPAGRRVYIAQGRVNGASCRYTIGRHGAPWTTDQARGHAQEVLHEMANGRNPNRRKQSARHEMTLSEMCDRYVEHRRPTAKAGSLRTDMGRIARHIKPLLGRRRLSEITTADLETFRADVTVGKTATDVKTGPRGRAIVTGGAGAAQRALELLSAILALAVRERRLAENPAMPMRKLPGRKMQRFLSPDELARLGHVLREAAANTRSGTPGGANLSAINAIKLLLLTGCRKNEVLSLRWSDIDWQRKQLHLPDSKVGARDVPLGGPALQLLQQLPRLEGNEYVLPGRRQGHHFTGLQKVWNDLRARAGLDDVRLHDLRHTFGSVGAAHAPMPFVSAMLGHSSVRTTERYAHVGDDPLNQAANRVSHQIADDLGLHESAAGAEVVPLNRG